MIENNFYTLAWMRRRDAKLDRTLSVPVDHIGRLQRGRELADEPRALFALMETLT